MSSRRGKQRKSSDCEDEEDYRKKRDRNNQAVKKSRFKSKQKTQETQDRISKLKAENDALEDKVKMKSGELKLLKELILANCSNTGVNIDDINIRKLLEDDDDDDPPETTSSRKRK